MDPLFIGLLCTKLRETIARLSEDIPRYDQLVAWAEQNVQDVEDEFSRFQTEYNKLEALDGVTADDQALYDTCTRDVADVRATSDAMKALRTKNEHMLIERVQFLEYLERILLDAPHSTAH